MATCAEAFINAMAAAGISEATEHLVMRDQIVEQTFAVLQVHVVITRSMDEQQVVLQVLGERDRRELLVDLGDLTRIAAVTDRY